MRFVVAGRCALRMARSQSFRCGFMSVVVAWGEAADTMPDWELARCVLRNVRESGK